MTQPLSSFKRIVIKIGSALIVDQQNGLKRSWLESLADDVAWLRSKGCEVCLVSSGAIAMGRMVLSDRLSRDTVLRLEESQAAAAIGQIELGHTYATMFKQHGQLASQILLTLDDTRERTRYLNARSTIETLLQWNSIPVINENDTVATAEIRYGDNDRLAARVTSMIGADLLILLSDVDGMYEQWPPENPDAGPIERIPSVTPEVESMAGDAATVYSSGGMKTKVAAAKIATASGAAMVITSGNHLNPVRRLADGAAATWFDPVASPVSDRKKWIAGQINTVGTITIDEGACLALGEGNSLLPAGVTAVNGIFVRGDTVAVHDSGGREVARGLIAFDSCDAVSILGKRSEEIIQILGAGYRTEMIHRDDMVVHEAGK